jgi:uncharacterized protein (DUF111 family)
VESTLSDEVKKDDVMAISILAEAEGKVHGAADMSIFTRSGRRRPLIA